MRTGSVTRANDLASPRYRTSLIVVVLGACPHHAPIHTSTNATK
jgi:hypothetical protein